MRKLLSTIILLLFMTVGAFALSQQRYVPDLRQSFLFEGDKAVEPEDDVAFESLKATAFHIPSADSQQVQQYTLLKDEAAETTVFLIDSGLPGASVYIVAGTHGDERAGWYAAFLLAESCRIDTGRLYVLPQANVPGCELADRFVAGSLDLNRAYPGNPEGDLAQRLADEIYKDIQRVKPTLLLDLHEAAFFTPDRDFMGQKLIVTGLDGIESLLFNFLTIAQESHPDREPFDLVGPGVSGSLNREVTQGLLCPVITVETFRGFPLSMRIQDQLDFVLYCLKSLGMILP